MEAIKLNTRLGKVKMAIIATLRNDKVLDVAKIAARHIVYHEVPSAAGLDKDDSKFQRTTAYSAELAEFVVASTKEGLGDLFESVEITASEHISVTPLEKLVKQFIGLGMTEADAKVLAEKTMASVEASKPSEKPAETKVEA